MITAEELARLKTELENLPAVIADVRREMRYHRQLRHLSVRSAAEEMGIPPTTLSRFEKSDGIPHVDTLLAVLRWIAAEPNSSQEIPR